MTVVCFGPGCGSFFFKNVVGAHLPPPHLHDRQWLMSFMTEAELEQWALLSNWQSKRIEWLQAFLGRFVIVPSSRDLVLKWAEVMVAARRNGRRLESTDASIAATTTLYAA